jgi:hypothetical protein
MLGLDLNLAVPSVGDEISALDYAEIEASRAGGPVLPLLWKTLSPVVPVEDGDVAPIAEGAFLCIDRG